jgi:hypothetical protein
MAIPHSAPGDLIDVRPLGPALASARTHALFKSNDLEVIRRVLPAGSFSCPAATCMVCAASRTPRCC